MSRNPRSPTPGYLDPIPVPDLGTTLKASVLVIAVAVGSIFALSFPTATLFAGALLLAGSGSRRILRGPGSRNRLENGATGSVPVPFTDLRLETRLYRKS